MKYLFLFSLTIGACLAEPAYGLAPFDQSCDFTGTYEAVGKSKKTDALRLVQQEGVLTGEIEYIHFSGAAEQEIQYQADSIIANVRPDPNDEGEIEGCHLDGQLKNIEGEGINTEIEGYAYLSSKGGAPGLLNLSLIDNSSIAPHHTLYTFQRKSSRQPQLQWEESTAKHKSCASLTGKYILKYAGNHDARNKSVGKLRIIQVENTVFGEFSWANRYWSKPNRVFIASFVTDEPGACKVSGTQKIAKGKGPERDLHILPIAGSDAVQFMLDTAPTADNTGSFISFTAEKIRGEPEFYWQPLPTKELVREERLKQKSNGLKQKNSSLN